MWFHILGQSYNLFSIFILCSNLNSDANIINFSFSVPSVYSSIASYDESSCIIRNLFDKKTIIGISNNNDNKFIICTKWKYNSKIIDIIIFGANFVLQYDTIYKAKNISDVHCLIKIKPSSPSTRWISSVSYMPSGITSVYFWLMTFRRPII